MARNNKSHSHQNYHRHSKEPKSELYVDLHPLGIKPMGSALLHPGGLIDVQNKRIYGLGKNIASLDDITIMVIVEYCDMCCLLELSTVSLWFYAWTNHPEIWKRLSLMIALQSPHNGTLQHMIHTKNIFIHNLFGWKFIYFQLKYQQDHTTNHQLIKLKLTKKKSSFFQIKPIQVKGIVYSDLLFHNHFISTLEFPKKFLNNDNIERRDYKNFSLNSFQKEFENENIPVLFTNCPLLQNESYWKCLNLKKVNKNRRKHNDDDDEDVDDDDDDDVRQNGDILSLRMLKDKYPTTMIHAAGYNLTLEEYFAYSQSTCEYDDTPLYIFDKHVLDNDMAQLGQDLLVPKYFEEDLFALLKSYHGSDDHNDSVSQVRPDWRWLICGPKRSGSSFHVDPNGTSAFNACLSGSKKWILFPPHAPPPGVVASIDGAEVRTPPTATEWFLNYYDESRKLPPSSQPIECVVKAGEVIFVPSGWWHCVLNLEDSVALTQNFVSKSNLSKVITFLKTQPQNISGLNSQDAKNQLLEHFLSELKKHYPECSKLAHETLNRINLCKEDVQNKIDHYDEHQQNMKKRRKVSAIVNESSLKESNAFSFSFSLGI